MQPLKELEILLARMQILESVAIVDNHYTVFIDIALWLVES